MDSFKKPSFSKITKEAINAAFLAGEILKRGFGTKYKINKKPGIHNLVTEYDIKSEKAIISYLLKKFPKSSFLSEEKGSVNKKNSDILWIIDPLDGTVNYAHRLPFFAVSIAAKKDDEIISGVIYNPMLNELFIAQKNKGAFFNNKKIQVSKTKKLKDSIIATGFPYNLNKNPSNCQDQFIKILKLGLPIRRLGAAALDLAYIADSRFDIFYETGLKPWDCAAGYLLIKEANGNVLDWSGKELILKDKINILATNSHLDKEILKVFS